jgi:hypothetical protein
MSRARNLADLLDASGDVKVGSLDNAISDVVGDTTPQLGGNLDLNSRNVTGTGAWQGTAVADGYVASASTWNTANTTANAALPKSGGAMTGAITTNSTFDGVDVATRDGVLSSTTTTANAALPKAGGTMTGNLQLGDGKYINWGNSNDLSIFHDGSNTYIDEAGTGNLNIRSSTELFLRGSNNETLLHGTENGQVRLNYDNANKLETSATGVSITGTCTATAFSGDGSALSNLPGGGKVLQVVQGTKTSASTFNSGSYTDIGLSVTITPSSSSSKILILGHLEIHGGDGVTSTSRLMRGGTMIDAGDQASNRTSGTWGTGNQGGDVHGMSQGVGYLDSPSTTSATTYKVQGMGASTCYVNRTHNDSNSSSRNRTASNLIAMEIGA